jgi:hypothetical protein
VNTSLLQPVKAAAGRVRERAQREADAYGAQRADRPLGGYLSTMSTYAAVTGTAALVSRWRGVRLPRAVPLTDVALLGVATYRLSRLLTREPITSPLRAKFTRYVDKGGPGELQEEPRGSGRAHAIGELVTCPFCMAQWVATGLVFAYVWNPRVTRWVAATMTAVAASNLMQFVHTRVDPS